MTNIVETFLIEETEELIYDNEKLDRWNEIVGELGLKGQQNLSKPGKSPIPFMHMNRSMVNIFSILCPCHVNVSEYSATPIPVEILSLLALANKEQYFSDLQVWYDEATPDPAVIGFCGSWSELTWYTSSNKDLKDQEFKSKQEAIDAGAKHPTYNVVNHYLIGKWADVKHSFDELKEIARKRFIAQKSNELKSQIKQYQRDLDDVEGEAFKLFGV